MIKKIFKISITALLIVAMSAVMFVPAVAANPLSATFKFTIKLPLKKDVFWKDINKNITYDFPVTEMGFTLYKIGDASYVPDATVVPATDWAMSTGDGNKLMFKTNSAFSAQTSVKDIIDLMQQEPTNPNPTATTPVRQLAANLEKLIADKKIDVTNVKKYNEKGNTSGEVVFDNIDAGLYLVSNTEVPTGTRQSVSYFIFLPYFDYDRNAWQNSWTVDATAKTEITEYVDIVVRKCWNVSGGNIALPTSVSIQLYNNGVAIGGPVTLSAATGWTYKWIHLRKSDGYYVTELNPGNYTVTYTVTKNGDKEIIYTVTNSTGKLPQTGQLNWPIPVLAGGGAVLLVIGFVAKKSGKNRKKDDE